MLIKDYDVFKMKTKSFGWFKIRNWLCVLLDWFLRQKYPSKGLELIKMGSFPYSVFEWRITPYFTSLRNCQFLVWFLI